MAGIFEEIYSNYKKPVYNYFYRCTVNIHTAEELTQDTFLKAFKYFSSFRGESDVKTWLFKIARNILNDYYKKNSRIPEEDIMKHQISDKDEIASAEEKVLIAKTLGSLTEEQREIIVLRDVSGFSYKDIADITGCSEGRVKIGLYRARKRFREIYTFESREGAK